MSRAEKLRRRKHRKERKAHRRFPSFPGNHLSTPVVRLSSYTISFDALPNELRPEAMEPEVDEALGDSRRELFELTSTHPGIAIPRLRELLRRFPDSPQLMNWLAAACGRVGNLEEFERLAHRNWQLHPDYLFARCNYAQLLLRSGKIEEAGVVMEHKWDLKALCPHRDIFHITEFLTFSQVAVEYFIRTGEFESAQTYFEAMKDLAPNHDVTRSVERILECSLLLHLAKEQSDGMLRRGCLPL